GDRLTAQDVSDTAVAPTPEPTLAVAVALPPPAGKDELADTELQLCLDGKPVGKPVRPVTVACQAKRCLVTLPVVEVKDLAAADATKRVRVVTGGLKCDGS